MENDKNKEKNIEEDIDADKELKEDKLEKNEISVDEEDNHHSELFVFKIISAVLALIIIVGVVIILKYAKFNGIDNKTLKTNYIKKSIIKFYDLPQEEQDNYVLKSDNSNTDSKDLTNEISSLKIKLNNALRNSQSKDEASDDSDILTTYKQRVQKLEFELYTYKQASLEKSDKIDIIKAKDDEIKILKTRIITLKEAIKPDLISSKSNDKISISSYIKKNDTNIKKEYEQEKIKSNNKSAIKSYLGNNTADTTKSLKIAKASKKRFKKVLDKNYNDKIKVPKPSKTTKDDAYNIHYYNDDNGNKLSNLYSNNGTDRVLKKRMYCKKYQAGSYEIPSDCMTKFEEFIQSSPEGSVFEIIPVIDVKDFNYIAKSAKSKEFKRLSEMGLGKLRSNEVGWNIKKLIGKDINLKYVPYNAYTDKIKRGVIIKVYN